MSYTHASLHTYTNYSVVASPAVLHVCDYSRRGYESCCTHINASLHTYTNYSVAGFRELCCMYARDYSRREYESCRTHMDASFHTSTNYSEMGSRAVLHVHICVMSDMDMSHVVHICMRHYTRTQPTQG